MSLVAMQAFRDLVDGSLLADLLALRDQAEQGSTFAIQMAGLVDSVQSINMAVGYNLPPAEQPTLEEAKVAKWAEILATRQIAFSVAPTSFGEMDSDAEGKANITGKAASLVILGDQAPAIVMWKRHDNSIAELTPEQFKQMSLEVTVYLEGVYALSWQIEAAIAAASSVEDVAAITWPAA